MTPPTSADVKALVSTSLSDAMVDVLIADAVIIAEANPSLVAASAAIQTAVIRWIACHFVSLSNSGQRTQEAIGDASESFASNSASFGAGLKGTVYGQRALMLEPTLARTTSLKPTFFGV